MAKYLGMIGALLLQACLPAASVALEKDWGLPEYAHCVQPYSWRELVYGYKNNSVSFKTGGLGRLLEPGGYKTWQCFRDHYCAVDPDDPWMCFVYHETDKVFTPWGENSKLKLVRLSKESTDFDCQTKEKRSSWLLVFRQTYPFVFNSSDSWAQAKALGSASEPNYSILGRLEEFRSKDGKFKFKLEYPELQGQANVWKQTSNPAASISRGVDGYEAIHITWTTSGWTGSNSWTGLEFSVTSHAFIDGTVDNSNRWYAIGAKTMHGKGIPGPGIGIQAVELSIEVLGEGT